MQKARVKMNKPLYLGMSILDISKTLMYKFWYDYFKLKYGDRAKQKNKKVITEFVALRPKAYPYLDDYGNNHIKAKGTKKCITNQKLMFQNFKDCLFNNKYVYRSQQRFKSYNHDVYAEEVNKIALNSNDDKRLQTFDRIKTYPYGTNAFKVCENEMLMLKKIKIKYKNDQLR